LLGYEPGSKRADLSFDTRDSAPFMPKSVVVDPSFSWGDDLPPDTPIAETIIYEAHVKGLTKLHPAAAPPGSFSAWRRNRCSTISSISASRRSNFCPRRPFSTTVSC
jgi:pullulanase/glycogen debranching enzyme